MIFICTILMSANASILFCDSAHFDLAGLRFHCVAIATRFHSARFSFGRRPASAIVFMNVNIRGC